MRCGRISVEGEPEEIAVSPRTRYRQRHVKRSNPFSTSGLDKFEGVCAELSARREYIAKKTGAPKALVRFSYLKNEWIPVGVRAREGIGMKNGGASAVGVSIPGPVEKNNGNGYLRRNDEGNDINGECESISISVLDERSHSLVMPWSRCLKTTAFLFVCLSALWVRKSAVSAAAAMAVVVVVAVGGVMCMKKFILSGVSFFATIFRNPRNLKTSQNGGGIEAFAEQKDVNKFSKRTRGPGFSTVSVPSSPFRGHVQPIDFSSTAPARAMKPKIMDREQKCHHHQSKAKTFRRVVSMDNRPTRPARPQGSDSFYWRTRPAMTDSANVHTTAMIIALFCMVFYGRLCAILLTSAWWYLLQVWGEHSERMRRMNRYNDSRMVDLQSSR